MYDELSREEQKGYPRQQVILSECQLKTIFKHTAPKNMLKKRIMNFLKKEIRKRYNAKLGNALDVHKVVLLRSTKGTENVPGGVQKRHTDMAGW